MTETALEWISSFSAIQVLRGAGVVDPVSTLTQLAEAAQVRARASRGRFDRAEDVQDFPPEPDFDSKTGELLAPWPDIPADFWCWVNAGSHGTEVHGEAGVFAATVVFDAFSGGVGDYRYEEHIKLYGVTFRREDLDAVIGGLSLFHPTPALIMPSRSRAGRKPELERWAEFGAALAFVAIEVGPSAFSSQTALYEASVAALHNRNPLDERTVRKMLRHAVNWVEGGEIPPRG